VFVPRLLVVDREERLLSVYRFRIRQRRYELKKTYKVAVGKIGHETPHGLYFVQAKSRRPSWRVPESPDYPEYMWGRVYKFGEEGNPFAGGFISLTGEESGIGLHGTSFDPHIGEAASHGCIRMRTGDLLQLYDKCGIETPVYIH
jgi:lipoprotein-anchoring transpeptidase ErfK/SrfK